MTTRNEPTDRPPRGRPSNYREEYVEGIVAFCAQGYSITAYAGEIGVARDTISEWAKVHSEFSAAVKRAKAACGRWWEDRGRHVAENGGNGGQATMVIFGLKNMAPEDFRDKTETELSGKLTLEQLVGASFKPDDDRDSGGDASTVA